MKPSVIIGIILAIAVIGGPAYFFWGAGYNRANDKGAPAAGMLAEENAIIVSEQRPGASAIVSLAVLAAPGYVVVHEDNGGQPGTILGASGLLQAGENANVSITLLRQTRDGERLHAMLHFDTDGSGSFDSSADVSVQSKLGGPISGWFEISSSASADVPISI